MRWAKIILTALIGLALAAQPVSVVAAPMSQGEWGTATDVNSQVTGDFFPEGLVVCNIGAANDLFFDYTDGVAAATSGGTNQRLLPGKCVTFSFSSNISPNTPIVIGFICSAGLSTTYNTRLVRSR